MMCPLNGPSAVGTGHASVQGLHPNPSTLLVRYVHNLQRFEFDFNFDIPATYPATAPEIRIPELEGKTAKMYRGGSICLTVHFKPLWAKNRCFLDHLRGEAIPWWRKAARKMKEIIEEIGARERTGR